MPLPNHADSCQVLKFFKTSCPQCNQSTHYLECTCGSKVFFESLAPHWNRHECVAWVKTLSNLHESLKAKAKSEGAYIFVCPVCGEKGPWHKLAEHIYLDHQADYKGQPPSAWKS